MSEPQRQGALDRARRAFFDAGADGVLVNLEQLPAWLEANDEKGENTCI